MKRPADQGILAQRRQELRPCFCIGPQPGHDLCPCAERREGGKDARIRLLELENRRLRTGRVREIIET